MISDDDTDADDRAIFSQEPRSRATLGRYPLRASQSATPKRVRERRRHTTTMFGNLFGGSGSKSGSKASVSAPGACPRRRPRGSRDDVRSAFRPVRAW